MTDPATLRKNLKGLERTLNSEFVERNEVIHTAVLALTSQSHHFVKSVPGTGKSAMIKRLVAHVGGLDEGDYFERLLTRFTNYSELFGAVDILALQEGVYRLITKNKLPQARVFFGDEIFKSSSSILNSLLKILNEREFENEFGEPIKVPLSTGFFGSNELPESDELLALWDRIHFRHFVDPIRTSSGFQKMLRMNWEENPEPKILWSEIVEIQNLAKQVEVSKQVMETLGQLRKSLAAESVFPSDRRFMHCLDVIRAEAFYNDHPKTLIVDMKPLSYVLWTHESNIKMVDKMIIELAAPIDRAAMDLLEDMDRLTADLRKVEQETDSPKLVRTEALRVITRLKEISTEIGDLHKKYGGDDNTEKVKELKDRWNTMNSEILTKQFGYPLTEGEQQ